MKAMKTLGFGAENTAELLRITAGLLHLGQVNFVGTSDGEGSAIDPSPYVHQAIKTAAGKSCLLWRRRAYETTNARLSHLPLPQTYAMSH